METKLEAGHLLNDAQKKVKGLIMNRLMETIPLILNQEKEVEFDTQTLTDVVMSCLMMFMREQLANFFLNSNALDARNQVMSDIFERIKVMVNMQVEAELKDQKEKMN